MLPAVIDSINNVVSVAVVLGDIDAAKSPDDRLGGGSRRRG